MKEWISNLGAGMMIVVVICIAAAFLMFPFAVIWALNTLFNLGIEYGIMQYLAICVLNIRNVLCSVKD